MAGGTHKIQVEHSVRAQGSAASGNSRSDSIRAEAQQRQSERARDRPAQATNGRVQSNATAVLTRGLDILTKIMSGNLNVQRELLKISKEQLAESKRLRNSQRSGGGGGGGGDGGGLGLHKLAAALPIAGAIVAAVSVVVDKVLEVGRKRLELEAQQVSTAGMGGFQAGRHGIFGPAALGEFAAESARASGRYYRGAAAQGADEQLALDFAAVHGQSAGEAGKMSGLFRSVSSDPNALQKTMSNAMRAGIESGMPDVMQMVVDEMSTAVTEGVNNSEMPQSLTATIGALYRASPTQNLQGILQMVGRMQRAGEGVRSGQQDTLVDAEMREEALQMYREDEKLRSSLTESGIGTGDAELDLNNPVIAEAIAQAVIGRIGASEVSARVLREQVAYARGEQGIAEGGTGTAMQEATAFAQFNTFLQQYMKEVSGTVEQNKNLYDALMGRTVREGNAALTPEQVLQERLGASGAGAAMTTAGLQAERESMILSNAGVSMARDAVVALDQAMINMADAGGTFAAKAINALTSGFDAMAKKAEELDEKLREMTKGPIGDILGNPLGALRGLITGN